MKLYHGTSGSAARTILTEGLQPRSFLYEDVDEEDGQGNWHHSVPSNPECVYLTNAYAGYFAAVAADDEEEMAIIEVETDDLDEDFMCPDEDFMEQASRGQTLDNEGFEGLLEAGSDMKERTLWFRDNILAFSHMWRESIKHLGTCCYYSGIDPSDILRVSFINQKAAAKMVMLAMDPSICLMNYQIIGGKYRTLTQWFMGEPVEVEQLSTWGVTANMPPQFRTQADAHHAALREITADQSMIRVVTP